MSPLSPLASTLKSFHLFHLLSLFTAQFYPGGFFYRIVPFNEGLEKLIFPSVASFVAIRLIKLHGIFNLAS